MSELRLPSILVSAALHLAVLLAALITWPLMTRPLQLSQSVPITIVSNAPPGAARPTFKAPEPAPAAAPEPSPEPAPAPTPPTPEPRPTPKPAPTPTPTPTPTPRPPQPQAQPHPEPRPQPSLDLADLAKSQSAKRREDHLDLSSLASQAPAKARAPADRGPPRPATDLLAQLASGRSIAPSRATLSALADKLNRLWHLDCDAPGAANVIVRVEIKIAPDGRLIVPPALVDRSGVGAPPGVVEEATRRALAAVRQGEPYTEIPKEVDHDITLRFNARDACQAR